MPLPRYNSIPKLKFLDQAFLWTCTSILWVHPWPIPHPSIKFCWNQFRSFTVILLTYVHHQAILIYMTLGIRKQGRLKTALLVHPQLPLYASPSVLRSWRILSIRCYIEEETMPHPFLLFLLPAGDLPFCDVQKLPEEDRHGWSSQPGLRVRRGGWEQCGKEWEEKGQGSSVCHSRRQVLQIWH